MARRGFLKGKRTAIRRLVIMILSIITINRNNATGLERTMQSVLSQTWKDYEYVIVDGASTDSSVDVIKRMEGSFGNCLKWVSEPDNGIYHAMNKGIGMASGQYVMILNSSDCIAGEHVLEQMIQYLQTINQERSPDYPIDLLLGNIVPAISGVATYTRRKQSQDGEVFIPDFSMLTFFRGTVPHDAAFMRKAFLQKYGMYDETMKICSDWKLFMHAIALGEWRFLDHESLRYIPPIPPDNIRQVNLDMVLFDMTGISERNRSMWETERRPELEKSLPAAILKDYDRYACDIMIMKRFHCHPIVWKLIRFIERVVFKLEKWGLIDNC